MKEKKILNCKVEADASKYYFIRSFLGEYLCRSGGDKQTAAGSLFTVWLADAGVSSCIQIPSTALTTFGPRQPEAHGAIRNRAPLTHWQGAHARLAKTGERTWMETSPLGRRVHIKVGEKNKTKTILRPR